MKLKNVKKFNDNINLRYTTTYRNSWNSCVNMAQIILDDIFENIRGIGYFAVAGAPVNFVSTITEGCLHKTSEFKDEHGGIFIEGESKALNLDIAITIYNQLDIVDVIVFCENDEVSKKFEKSVNFLDEYMDSIEINGYSVGSVIKGMFLLNAHNIFSEHMFEKYEKDFSWDKTTEEEKRYLKFFKYKFDKLGFLPWEELPTTWEECKKRLK